MLFGLFLLSEGDYTMFRSALLYPSQSHIATEGQSVSQSVLVSSPHLGLMTRYLLINCTGFWRWCVTLITTGFLDLVHRPEFYKQENTTFRKLDLFPSSGEGGGHLLY
jgi:hypothetical protein